MRASAALSSPDSLWISACPLVVLAETQVVQSSSCCLSWRIWSFAEATLARAAVLGPGGLVLPIALEIGPSGMRQASSADDRRPTDPIAVFVYEAVPRAAKRTLAASVCGPVRIETKDHAGDFMTAAAFPAGCVDFEGCRSRGAASRPLARERVAYCPAVKLLIGRWRRLFHGAGYSAKWTRRKS